MLLLKGLQNTADVKFENQLRSSAMRIASREVLYYFLKKEPVEAAESDEAIDPGNPSCLKILSVKMTNSIPSRWLSSLQKTVPTLLHEIEREEEETGI